MTPETMEAVVQTPEPEEGGGRWRRRALVGIGVLCVLSLGYSVGASAEDPKAKPEAQPRNDSALRAQLSDARTENEDLAAQIDDLERDNATLEGDNAELEDEVATLEDEVAALETENVDLRTPQSSPRPRRTRTARCRVWRRRAPST